MARYFIESKHTDAQCLQALDDIVAHNPRLLEDCYLGCMVGEHTGWAIVEAGSDLEARNMLPGSLRGEARVVSVGQFTPEQIRSFHKAA